MEYGTLPMLLAYGVLGYIIFYEYRRSDRAGR